MKGNKCKIIDLTNFINCYFKVNGLRINHLKLHKILYYVQAWHLVYFEQNPLFDEEPEAWVNGPVYRSVYNFIRNELPEIKRHENFSIESSKLDEFKSKLNLIDDQYEFLDSVFNHYAPMSHEKLVFMTHWESPWKNARIGLGPFDNSTNKITYESMFEYYSKRLIHNLEQK